MLLYLLTPVENLVADSKLWLEMPVAEKLTCHREQEEERRSYFLVLVEDLLVSVPTSVLVAAPLPWLDTPVASAITIFLLVEMSFNILCNVE